MTLNQLKYFCAACRSKSITKAAKELFVTQPTISIAIRELEMEFACTLFYRKGNQLILTGEGEAIYQKASEFLRYSEDIQHEFMDIGHSFHPVHIGIPPMLSTIFFPVLLDAFHEEYPEIEVILDEYGSVRACNMVQSDELDLALVNMEQFNIDKFNSQVLARDRLVFVVAANHPFAGKGVISTEELARENLILFNADSVQNDLMKNRFESMDIQPRIIMRSSQIYTTLQFISKGNCGCFFFERMLPLFPDFTGIQLEPDLPVKIGLVWKKGKYVNSETQHFIDFTKKYYREKGQNS